MTILDNLTEPSEDSKTFYPSEEVEESPGDNLDAEEDESSEEAEEAEGAEELADGDAEEEAGDEDDEESVTVFGKEITREEFDLMQNQQLMQADYTKKMQAVAEQRKQTEALGSDLSALIAEFESEIVGEGSEEELAELLEDDDSAEYIRRTNAIKAKKGKIKAAKAKLDETLKATQAEESKKLVEVMTEWLDPKKGQAAQKSDMSSAVEYSRSIGFSDAELDKLADHKVIRALIDAGKYRALLDSKPATTKVKTKASKKVSAKKAVEAKKATKSTSELFYGDNK
jgi:fused signal recognition particle receptor